VCSGTQAGIRQPGNEDDRSLTDAAARLLCPQEDDDGSNEWVNMEFPRHVGMVERSIGSHPETKAMRAILWRCRCQTPLGTSVSSTHRQARVRPCSTQYSEQERRDARRVPNDDGGRWRLTGCELLIITSPYCTPYGVQFVHGSKRGWQLARK
jgi:hypothetical protein